MDRALAPALYDAIAALYRQARIRMQAVSSADNVLGHLQLVQEGLAFALLAVRGDPAGDPLGDWIPHPEGLTYAEKITAADRTLDPARPAAELERAVRALRPRTS